MFQAPSWNMGSEGTRARTVTLGISISHVALAFYFQEANGILPQELVEGSVFFDLTRVWWLCVIGK
jgi:hypothetical protein